MTADRALLFPGQGAQHVGMGVDIVEAHPAARAVFDEASACLGLDLLELCRQGPAEALVRTDIQQPAILAVGAATIAALREADVLPEDSIACAFGLSLGEFTALWAAGALGLGDALVLVRERGLGMQEASEQHPSSMLALRAEEEAAERLCAAARTATGGVLQIANFNAPGQVVISGDLPSIEAAEGLANAHGIRRPIRLPVAGAFHSPLMQAGADRLARTLEGIEIRSPRVPVISNVNATPTRDPAAIRQNLIDQVTHPVRFVGCVEAARSLGVRAGIEAGPGRVLTGLVRRIDREIDLVPIPDKEAAVAFVAAQRSAPQEGSAS